MNHVTECLSRPEPAALELAKWVAIVAMTLDHYGKIVAPEVLIETHAAGRLALPLFALIVATRATDGAGRVRRYLAWLVPAALVAQPFYVEAGREWLEGNILFTLALGVVSIALVQRWRAGERTRVLLLGPPVVVAAWFVEFGIPGVALVVALSEIARRDWRLAAWLSGPLALVANASLEAPVLEPADGFAVLASAVAVSAAVFPLRLPRLPRWFFYAYYPVHLFVLDRLDAGW